MYYIMRKSYYVMHKLLRYAKKVLRYAVIITLCGHYYVMWRHTRPLFESTNQRPGFMINRFALSFLCIELDRTRNVRGHQTLYTTRMPCKYTPVHVH